MNKSTWAFYGRQTELAQLENILIRDRWFFLRISGRRRIGKTSLIQQVLESHNRKKVLYLQVPDSDAAGVLASARDFYETFDIPGPYPHDLLSLAKSIGLLVRDGYIIAMDEFQYFNRKILFEFNSFLQTEIDHLSADADNIRGGLIVLGSIYTEMSALLEDRTAPLFNRLTDQIDLDHLDISSLMTLLSEHANPDPERLLMLWNLFEGVPKYYRDCYEQGVLSADRDVILRTMFFTSSSPLRNEAANLFLHEMRGRYDLVLKYIASHAGCTGSDLADHVQSVSPDIHKQVSGYLGILMNRYHMIDRHQPILASQRSRQGRYYIRDNFLRAWLTALATPCASIHFRPLDHLVKEASTRLRTSEGYGLERLAGLLYEERSRKGIGDFSLSHRILGYWDRSDVEIDLVAVNEPDKIIRFGTCRRNPEKLRSALSKLDKHINGFMKNHAAMKTWKIEKVAIAPRVTSHQRQLFQSDSVIVQDLDNLTKGL